VWPRPEAAGQPHRPHLTISRAVSRAGLTDPVRALTVYRGPEWEVTEAVLFESRLGQGVGGKSLYVPLAVAPLS